MKVWWIALIAEGGSALLFAGLLLRAKAVPAREDRANWALIWLARMGAMAIVLGGIEQTSTQRLVPYFALELASAALLAWIARRHTGRLEAERQLRRDLEARHSAQAAAADQDALTGLESRAALERFLADPGILDGTLVVCDIDNFKAVNDQFGHLAGDEALHGVGQLIRASIRRDDLAFRWGGDEFVLFFRNVGEEIVGHRMAALEKRLDRFHLRNSLPSPIALSWGAVEIQGQSPRQALSMADRAMYERKRKHASQVAPDTASRS